MNEIVNKFLLVGNKFLSEMHLKQPGFTYSAWGPFRKSEERNKKFMQTGNTDFIHRNELDKACFQHDMTYCKSKDLANRTESDKVLRDEAFKIASDKAFKIVSDPKNDEYQQGLASMVYKFFDEKSSGSDVVTEPNYQLANELHRQILRKICRGKVYSSFRESAWEVYLADMQSLNKYIKGIKYLFCEIDIFSKLSVGCYFKRKKRN